MNELSLPTCTIPSMSQAAIDKIHQFELFTLAMPQVDISTNHVLHGGMYARTIMIPAGVVLTGALIKIATILIVQGDVTVHIGEEAIDLCGYHVLPASANRKQAFFAKTDTYLTMIFSSNVETVEEAEMEFTDDADRLISRKSNNHMIITGE